MKYILFLFPIFLQAQCLIPTHSYRLICADEVRYADSISSGSRLYISSRNAFVTSPRSVFSLVNGYGQHFIQITNSANSQKVAINRAWINRIDSTSGNKALIYIKDISVTFTTTESYTAVKDSAIACFIRSVASGLATLSDGDYGDVVVSGGGLVMTVDKPDLGLHNLADGDFSVVADSTALSLTGTRSITLQTQNIDNWISRYLQTHNSLTLRTNNTTKTSRIFVDTTGANFQFVNGANNASLRIGDSVAVRFNTSGSVGQVLTVTSVDGDGRLVINPKAGGSGTANCEQTLTKNSHGFSKWTPIYWNGSAWSRPTFDSIIPTYIVVDSTSANTFKVSNCGNYSSTLTAGLYYYTGTSPGYSLTPTSIPTPIFEVAQARLILQPLVGFNLAGGSGNVTSAVLADTAAAIRADFQNGIISELPLRDVDIDGATSSDLRIRDTRIQFDGKFKVGSDSSFVHDPSVDSTRIKGNLTIAKTSGTPYLSILGEASSGNQEAGIYMRSRGNFSPIIEFDSRSSSSSGKQLAFYNYNTANSGSPVFVIGSEPGQFGARSIGRFSIWDTLNLTRRFSFFSNGTGVFDSYGTGAKEATDVIRTQSNYLAAFATDGTVLDLNIGSGLAISGGSLISTGDFSTFTDAIYIPAGTTAQRSGTGGVYPIRYNTDIADFEVSNASGTWHILPRILKGSATLDFASTAAGAVTDLTITVTGAADGDVVSISVPNASQTTTGSFSAWVSASNTVTVRYRITALVGSEDPASGVFKVTVTK